MRCLDAMLSMDGSLGKKETQKRKLFFVINVVLLFVLVGLMLLMFSDVRGRFFYVVGILSGFVTVIFNLSVVACKRRLSPVLILAVSCSFWVCALLVDISSRAQLKSTWPAIVLIVDFVLVMEVPAHHSTLLVCVTVLYLIVISVEESFRFGLLDLPGLMQVSDRRSYADEMTQCADIPCARNTTPALLAALMVFVVDFIATRGFARGLRKEQESMERTINTVQEIASLLAGYDVEQVAELLKVHGGDLPEGMTVALRRLEENLRVYKAYLPKTCLPFDNEDGDVTPSRRSSRRESAMTVDDTSTDSATQSASTNSAPVPHSPSKRVQRLGLTPAKATLLTLNVKDTLCRLADDVPQFSELFATLLLKTLQGTETRRGMVDVFIGDRIHCSFNASKQCASHATSALHTATLLIRGGVTSYANMGVATGTLLRGDMGCEVMRRFSMVGELVRDVNGLERVGRMLGCDVVCNRMCFSDAECEHQLRLLPCKVELASGCEGQVVAELVVNEEEETAEEADEWMYMIGGKKDWEEYNIAVRGYLRGEKSDLDVAKAWSAAGGVGTPAHTVPSGTFRVVCSYLR